MNLQGYVGRIVTLNQDRFRAVARRTRHRGGSAVENRFIVASADRQMGKLICYGADLRVAVDAAEVILV